MVCVCIRKKYQGPGDPMQRIISATELLFQLEDLQRSFACEGRMDFSTKSLGSHLATSHLVGPRPHPWLSATVQMFTEPKLVCTTALVSQLSPAFSEKKSLTLFATFLAHLWVSRISQQPQICSTFSVALPGDLQAFSPSGWLEVAMRTLQLVFFFRNGHSCHLRQDRVLMLTFVLCSTRISHHRVLCYLKELTIL